MSKTRKIIFEVDRDNNIVSPHEEEDGCNLWAMPEHVLKWGVLFEEVLTEQAEDEFRDNLDKVIHHTDRKTNPVDNYRAENRLIRVVNAINVLQEENLV